MPKKKFAVDDGTFLAVFRETQEGSRVYTEEDGFFYIGIENDDLDFESFAIWPNEGDGFLDHIELLDSDEVKYNISVYYVGPDDEFRGFMELQNASFDVHSGDLFEVTVPATIGEIDQDTYQEFLDWSTAVAGQGYYGIRLI